MTLLLTCGVLPTAAVAADPASTITLRLSPTTIVADGKSTTTATATVTDPRGNPVTRDRVVFSSGSGQPASATTNSHDGTYTATITSTTKAGTATIRARDTTAELSATATLTQVPGPAALIVLQLSPSTIAADGASTSTAVATVSDAFNNPVQNAVIVFSASDSGVRFSPAINTANGTYVTTVTSSKTPGTATVAATDSTTGVRGNATLMLAGSTTKTPSYASIVTLSAAPAAPVTNQVVSLIAVVTAGDGPAPAGAITFKNRGTPIAGCTNEPVSAFAAQRLSQGVCQISLGASASPAVLEADFTSSLPNVTNSSTTATIGMGRSATSTSVDISNPAVSVGSTATFAAQVAPSNAGPVRPSGSVDFFDNGQPIAACSNRPLTVAAGSSTATCTVTYASASRHSITARYGGDANFTGSASAPPQSVSVHALPLRVLGTIKTIMRWTFFYTPTYTMIRALVLGRAPVGATITVTCRGGGCPFATRVNNVRRSNPCRSTAGQECRAQDPGIFDLWRSFQSRHLRVGAQVSVKVTRVNWIGKYYRFTVRPGKPPVIRIDCLAPGGTRPGVGC